MVTLQRPDADVRAEAGHFLVKMRAGELICVEVTPGADADIATCAPPALPDLELLVDRRIDARTFEAAAPSSGCDNIEQRMAVSAMHGSGLQRCDYLEARERWIESR